MSTTTETSTIPLPEPAPAAPELTVLNRVANIPLVASSLHTLDTTLNANAYTRASYSTARRLSLNAYKYTEPLQARLAPLIIRTDDIANKAVDAVAARYPYPFTAQPEDVATLVRDRRDSAAAFVKDTRASAAKTLDERVTSPVRTVAAGFDQRFSPIVDYFEVAVTRLDNQPSTSTDAYQYQRALALSSRLRDQLYGYSNEQLAQLQAHSALVQRAADTAAAITALAASSLAGAQARIHTLSDTMLLELQRLQASAAALGPALQSSVAHAQAPAQHAYAELAAAAAELRALLAEDAPLQDKAARAAAQVRERVGPLLDGVRARVGDALGQAKSAPHENGNGNGVHAPDGGAAPDAE